MMQKDINYLSLILWAFGLILIGSLIGSATKTEVNTWYETLARSPLTPPNYVFGIVWTILYFLIGVSGWFIWSQEPFPRLNLIKTLYIIQLILNWSWTPLFFTYKSIYLSLVCLISIDLLVASIIYLSYENIKMVSFLMLPYMSWILLATHLNFYIWQYN